NVIALAAGICDGLGFGDNAKAALMTRGLAEMARFGTRMGARSETFSGLAGVGDLITTCISPHGRNRHVGERLGKGETLQAIRASMNAVAEGVFTADAVHRIARQLDVPMPITAAVVRVLNGESSAREAAEALMLRPPRDEFDPPETDV
ncbi:MAG: glycerol-3-phosphate dehydrogenase, partial [Planctomycetota bacterium]